jgi:Zn-dependent protease with chaperone function
MRMHTMPESNERERNRYDYSMNSQVTGKLTLLEAPPGKQKEALISYLANFQKTASREKLAGMISRLPLELGKNIPEHLARRITSDMEALGAKLNFSPNSALEKDIDVPRKAGDTPAKSLHGVILTEAFSEHIIRFPISRLYRAGLLLVAIAMILLPVVYLGIISGAAYLLYWHATANLEIFSTVQSTKAALFLYVTPMVVGTILIFFLVKPLFARRPGKNQFFEVRPSDEPLLHAFIEKVCAIVGAPVPNKVRIDTQVNASAGFRRGIFSFSGSDLVLTIGLPLAAGLNLNQFTGVLAHEFGHFAQSSGMRLTYVIRSINYWFSRVVYDEDEWDVRLRRWSREIDFRIAIILWTARFFIWVSRKVLLVLMKAGHFISCFMLRQMEFDADRYEAALVGGDVFESTCDKLALLSVAHSWAFEDLSRSWEEGRLADNLPELVMVNLHQMKDEARTVISEGRTASRTGVFDTHPADTDRIASARAVSRTPVFSWPKGCGVKIPGATPDGLPNDGSGVPPATILFRDFSALSKKVTMDYYRHALGRTPDRKSMVDVSAMVHSQNYEKKYNGALERYFLGRFTPWFPLRIMARRLTMPADPEQALRQLRDIREGILRQDAGHDELLQQYFRLTERIGQVANAKVLIEAGFTINHKDFNLPGAGLGDIETAERRHAERGKYLLGEIENVNRLYRDRLTLGLQLLQIPSVAGQTGEGEKMLMEVETTRKALDVLEDQFLLMGKLHVEFRQLAILTHQIANNEDNEKLINTIRQKMETVRQDLGFLREGLGHAPYPFDHVSADMTMGLFVVEPGFEVCDLGGLLGIAETAIDRMHRTYIRLAARLALAAEEVEKIHGLLPLKEA